ncbi:prepilin peptidase [Arthrobacter sp. 18067]|uniref:prepilin peptidase n=1 Tax=Arthrobacter sp. 18067 TaxID=2681413 RepID=UPI0013579ED6|nr:prepilin peptidase [Arthrobacter sp. 18067]
MTDGPAFPLIIALAGLLLSPASEFVIARGLPQLGGVPSPRVRMTTAAVTALLFGLLAWRFGISLELPAFLLLALLGVQLSRIDFTLHLLPNALIVLLLGGGLLLLAASAALVPGWPELLRAVAGGAILFAGYLILGLISPGSIGMGDVKLAAPLGMYLGYLGWQQLFYGALLGFVVGGVLTVLMLRMGNREKPRETAHGPAMVSATLGVILLLNQLYEY